MAQLAIGAIGAVIGGFGISGSVFAIGGGLTFGAKVGWMAASACGSTYTKPQSLPLGLEAVETNQTKGGYVPS